MSPPIRLQLDVVRVMHIDAAGQLVGARFYGRDAAEGGGMADPVGYALRLIDEDEQRLGRPRARSGAERLLRAAGFTDPWRYYAFAMDRRSANRRRAA
jgi:hypothetical protein